MRVCACVGSGLDAVFAFTDKGGVNGDMLNDIVSGLIKKAFGARPAAKQRAVGTHFSGFLGAHLFVYC